MFKSQAHSFTQQARLAISLSWVAGYTNALTLLVCGQVTSHLTGSVSQIGVETAELQWSAAGYHLSLVLVFLAGAFTSGALTEFGRMRRFQSIYVLPMATEALLLGLFALLIDWQANGGLADGNRVWLTFLPSFAMGMQNATITRISGGVVRTTHVTGVVTDLGLELSKIAFRLVGWKRRLDAPRAAQERWRTLLLLSIPGSFALGAGLGTICFDFAEAWSMVPAVAFLVFMVGQDYLVPIAAVELRSGEHDGAPIIALYHAEPPADGGRFRMPDLTTWASHIDEHVRVVVLDLSNLAAMGERSALEIRALLLHLRQEGKALVLGGCGKDQIAVLQNAGVLLDFDADDLCSDLHQAAARAEQLAAEL
jgi:uncharacterized membrane protein YoaK (UPF0700 family)